MTSLNKDGSPTVPLCMDCRWFSGGSGIGALATCATPKRKGDFDVIYGWQLRQINPRAARGDDADCGVVGNFYEQKPPEPPPTRKERFLSPWQRFKEWLLR